MDFRPVSLRTKDRDLFGAWSALNKVLAALGGNPLLSPAYNAEAAPIPDGSVLKQISGANYVTGAVAGLDAEAIGIAHGAIPAEGTGLVQTGGRHRVRMADGLGPMDLVEGNFVYLSGVAGVATTLPKGQKYGFGIITDSTNYEIDGTVMVQLKMVVASGGVNVG